MCPKRSALALLAVVAAAACPGCREKPQAPATPPPPDRTFHDPATRLWLAYPADGRLVLDGPDVETQPDAGSPPAAVAGLLAGRILAVYPDAASAESAARGGDQPRVELWRLSSVPAPGGPEAVAAHVLAAFHRAYPQAVEAAEPSFAGDEVGGHRFNYRFNVAAGSGGAPPLVVRFVVLVLGEDGYLGWCAAPADLPARPQLDLVVSSLQFRRK